MSTLAQEPGAPGADLVRAELEAVLASGLFVRAPGLAQFLNYVCTKALSGEARQIKEYNIAVEALGRPAGFDQKADAIVRVEAHRLRKRLKQYYETVGADHPVQIVIPPGQYVPQFLTTPTAVIAEPREEPSPEEPRPLAEVIQIAPTPRPVRPRSRRLWVLLAALLLIASAASLMVLRREPAPGPLPPAAAAPRDTVRIACGLTGADNQVDSQGNLWLADRYGTGGEVISSPQQRILRTRDAALFQNRREGDFRYDIPLAPGLYELRLYFAELVYGDDNPGGGGETSRIFHVYLNGQPLVRMLDIISDAAGSNTADVRVFTGLRPAADGYLHLHFTPYRDKAFVNAIEIVPGLPGGMQPVRIVAGNSAYRDRSGAVWSADRFGAGGQVIARPAPTGSADPGLYRSERFGHFSYAIPAAPGKYTVTLHFAEGWFGPGKPNGGGVGSRLFDIYSNGVALLRNFDVYEAAGGANRAIVKTFENLEPNAQGKLVLTFMPVANYAFVNAIEVVAQPD